MQRNRGKAAAESFDEQIHTVPYANSGAEAELLRRADRELLRKCLEELPQDFREAIVLRELEGMSYREIADLANIPVGTVMSRLARARKRLESCVLSGSKEDVAKGDMQ